MNFLRKYRIAVKEKRSRPKTGRLLQTVSKKITNLVFHNA
jgi:hypothetical protein